MLDNVMCLAKKTFLQAEFSESWLDDFWDLLMVSFWDSKSYSCYKVLSPNQEWEGVSLVWTHYYMSMYVPTLSCGTCYESPNPCVLINVDQKCWFWGTSDSHRLGSHA